jgi:hypothetical protein
VTSRASAGPNELLAGGACVVRDAQDVLDAMLGAGVRRAAEPMAVIVRLRRPARRWQRAVRDSPDPPRPPADVAADAGDGGRKPARGAAVVGYAEA